MTDCALTGSSKVPRCFTAGLQERYRCSRDPSGNLTLYDMLKSGQARPSSGCASRVPGTWITPGILPVERRKAVGCTEAEQTSCTTSSDRQAKRWRAPQGADGQQGSLCSKTDVAGRTLPACHAPLACYPLKSGALVGAGLGYCTDTPNDMDQVHNKRPRLRPERWCGRVCVRRRASRTARDSSAA
jgi:hypothetical protein